jgi:Flp pilus assembly pilin Flp
MDFLALLTQLHLEECGQDLLEYALVMAAVLFAVVAGSNNVAGVISNAMTTVSTRIESTVS